MFFTDCKWLLLTFNNFLLTANCHLLTTNTFYWWLMIRMDSQCLFIDCLHWLSMFFHRLSIKLSKYIATFIDRQWKVAIHFERFIDSQWKVAVHLERFIDNQWKVAIHLERFIYSQWKKHWLSILIINHQ